MIWNLAADTTQGTYDTVNFNNQILSFGMSKAYQLNIRTLFDICRSISAWLSLDTRNVALIHCANGVGRTGIAISCFLRFSEIFDDTLNAFEYFQYRRTPNDNSWVTVSQLRYLQYFQNVVMLNGSVPNSWPLKLHRIILNGVPNFDGRGSCRPGLEIYQCGKLVYSTVTSFETLTKDGVVYTDNHNVIFRIPTSHNLCLEKDIQLRIFHIPDMNNGPIHVITMISFSFHTGFMPSGLVRVALSDLEITKKDLIERKFHDEFSLDFIFSEKEHRDADKDVVSYVKYLDKGLTRCLARLIGYHGVSVNSELLKSLEEVGCHKILACFALQKTNNDLQAAYDYLKSDLRVPEMINAPLPSLLKKDTNTKNKGTIRHASKPSEASSTCSTDSESNNNGPDIKNIITGYFTDSTRRPSHDSETELSPARPPQAQPEKPMLSITGKNPAERLEMLLSATATLPRPRRSETNSSDSTDTPRSTPLSPVSKFARDFTPVHVRSNSSSSLERYRDSNKVLLRKRSIDSQSQESDKSASVRRMEELLGQIGTVERKQSRLVTKSERSGSVPSLSPSTSTSKPPTATREEKDKQLKDPVLAELSTYLQVLKQRKTDAETLKGVETKSKSDTENLAVKIPDPEKTLSPQTPSSPETPKPWPTPPNAIDSRIAEIKKGSGTRISLRVPKRSSVVLASLPPAINVDSTVVVDKVESNSVLKTPVQLQQHLELEQDELNEDNVDTPRMKTDFPIPDLPETPVSSPPPPPPTLPEFKAPPAPPLPPIFKAPPPPPLPLMNSNISTVPSKPQLRARAKLHWNEIRNPQALEDSVWTEMAKELKAEAKFGNEGEGILDGGNVNGSVDQLILGNIKLDVKKFEELFCVVPGNEKGKTETKAKILTSAQFTTVLDLRRANNVSISLSQFTRRGLTYNDILLAIQNQDATSLSADDLLTIQTLLPTPDERKKLLAIHQPPTLPFAPAEQFMMEMLSVPDLPHQLVAFLFRVQLEIESEEVRDKLEKMRRICNNIRSSEYLKVVLKAVLQLGNMTNYNYSSGGETSYRPWMGKEARALGFKIDGLAKLKDVKSADGKWSLMNFLVDMLLQSVPEVVQVTGEFSDLKFARNFDIKEITTQILAMQSTLQTLQSHNFESSSADYRQRLNVFLNETATTIINGLFENYKRFAGSWTDAAKYFGEDIDEYLPLLKSDGSTMSNFASKNEETKKLPTHLFVTLDLFFRGFDEAVADHRNRIEEAERKRVREIRAKEDRERREVMKAEKLQKQREEEERNKVTTEKESNVMSVKERKQSLIEEHKEEVVEMFRRLTLIQDQMPDMSLLLATVKEEENKELLSSSNSSLEKEESVDDYDEEMGGIKPAFEGDISTLSNY
ncbi:hypothetical protein HK098_002253 [Nowakowskiella sp. JEL0407]|nr:hypothetical protein HK098_002253 [Nowakowskiella sp. JEL0407]